VVQIQAGTAGVNTLLTYQLTPHIGGMPRTVLFPLTFFIDHLIAMGAGCGQICPITICQDPSKVLDVLDSISRISIDQYLVDCLA